MSARAIWTILIVVGLALYLAFSSLFVVSEGSRRSSCGWARRSASRPNPA